MLTSSDFLHLPFTQDLTEGGIAYTIRSLPNLARPTDGLLFDHLRRRVSAAIVELAFRRHLGGQGISYEVQGALPFTDPDRYDVILGGHRCDIHSYLINNRAQIANMRRDPASLLRVPALVPSDQHAGEGHHDNDLYLFAFLAGLTTPSSTELKKAVQAGQPSYLTHILPEAWGRPQAWTPLGPLVLKSESDETLTVELNGQAEGRGFLSCVVELPPRTRVVVQEPFFGLTCIHIPRMFEGQLGIHSPRRRETHLVNWRDWGNLWIYGMEIMLAGYALRGEFRRRASHLEAGARVFQYPQTPEKQLALPIAELSPLPALLEQVREWDEARNLKP